MAILDIEIIKIAFKVQIHKVINIPTLKYILNCLVKIIKYFAKIQFAYIRYPDLVPRFTEIT